jgi:hypothetical protein
MAIAELRRERPREATALARSPALARIALIAGLALAVPGYVAGYALGLRAVAAHGERLRAGSRCLADIAAADDGCLRLLCWDTRLVRADVPGLRALHLGPFAAAPR